MERQERQAVLGASLRASSFTFASLELRLTLVFFLQQRGVPNTHTKTPIASEVWKNSHRIRFHSLATSNSSTKHAVMAPKGNKDGSYEIGHWAEDELRETYLDGNLEGVWACDSTWHYLVSSSPKLP